MSRSFITAVRINEYVLFQYIDTETGVVTFCENKPSSDQVALITIDSKHRANYHCNNTTTLPLGVFKYVDYMDYQPGLNKQLIAFEFSGVFMRRNKDVKISEIIFNTNEIINAECCMVKTLLTLYPDIFKTHTS